MQKLFKILAISSLCLVTTNIALAKEGLKKYTGAYFEISYPSHFIVGPAMSTNEAKFISPDQQVEFFVYSPLWSGKPENYLNVAQNEKLISENSQKTVKKSTYQDHIQIKWATISAKSGAYTRSYMHQRACHSAEFTDCLSLVFGIKYKNKQAYNLHRNDYIAFKKSLTQFSD